MRAEALIDLKNTSNRDKRIKRRPLQAVNLDAQPETTGARKHILRYWIIALFIFVASAVTGTMLLKEFIALFAIKHVLIEGEFHNTQAQIVEQVLAPHLRGDLFTVDLTSAHRALTEISWVADARLQRDWPDKVVVRIKEQTPVARWNQDRFLNADGVVFDQAYGIDSADLPLLTGPEHEAKEVINQFIRLQKSLAHNQRRILELRVDERDTWTLITHDSVIMHLGRQAVESRLQRFLAVMQSNRKLDWSKLVSVDLRHSNGFAVSWRAAPDNRQG